MNPPTSPSLQGFPLFPYTIPPIPSIGRHDHKTLSSTGKVNDDSPLQHYPGQSVAILQAPTNNNLKYGEKENI